MSARSPQIEASDPAASSFVTANAGSGKTSTLVDRVARLLLQQVRPEAILCVTFTKAAAAEMQRRLFERLGEWAVLDDDELSASLAGIDEAPADPSLARTLFARALETPGGLRIQTIHGFCEQLLRRFPLEAGVPPGFKVLDDQAAREVSAHARDDTARLALQAPDREIGRAYTHFAASLHYRGFIEMFEAFEARRAAIQDYVDARAAEGGFPADIWRRCGFDQPGDSEALRADAMRPPVLDPALWDAGAQALATGAAGDRDRSLAMAAVAEAARQGAADFDRAVNLFCTDKGEAHSWLDKGAVFKRDPALRDRLILERERLFAVREVVRAAVVAEDSIAALTLATAYNSLYKGAKQSVGALDFTDLIRNARDLLTVRSEAAWVLFKLDGGVDHILVDEAQDTSPDQWDIVRPLAEEFFSGSGSRDTARTIFAVGDEKQSIFSFQGALPERLAREARNYETLVTGAGRPFARPQLIQSWRSTPEVLSFVDAVFADLGAAEALRAEAGPGDPLVHLPHRTPGVGSVDIWPLEVTDPTEDSDAWEDPVDAPPSDHGNKKLARRIALEIRDMVARGEAVFDKDRKALRPMHAGDVLILVRRRGALFEEIIRALKQEDVPVGGADRLTLSDHVVFLDLTALARFCLYPRDDLSLAALLRSPLCDVDEASLYDLAYGREGRLWEALRSRADERPDWSSALELLNWSRSEGAVRPPFDFYARLLGRIEGGRSIRARFLTRLGQEAEQAIDAFLAEALAAERRGVRDMESLVAELEVSQVEVKREQDEGKGEVRVMTVHGAKGLEAPVVFLPDTATRATVLGGPLLSAPGGGFLWSRIKREDGAASREAREARERAGERESLRLLYVGLTRARDRLIVCGVTPGRANLIKDSWWDVMDRARALPQIAGGARELTDTEGRAVFRHGPDPALLPAETAQAEARQPLPDWAARPAPPEAANWRYASPSQMAESARIPAPSPLAQTGGLGRFRRGDLIHRLLEILPDVDPPLRGAVARSQLEREADLTADQRGEMVAAAMAVLEDAQFAAVFGPGSKAEVAIAGGAPELHGLKVSGRIDRLVVEADRVLVVDYKTNRPSPDRIEQADPAYITQMAVYAAVLRSAFPGRRVEAALVWTDGPKLMTVPENLMARALLALPPSG